ncbi:MAG: hypothetical protein M1837_002566 [Sclerophora amabilis]|nr:MAG: hypothetical protein M1837_002566 [Sclerophora amabilis]
MAQIRAGDAATRERIMKHMNADHQDSLCRYLEFYCRLPSSLARHARLAEITFDHMILTSAGTRNIIPFDPPLQSWSDVRPRVVKMDEDAMTGLGRSDITIREYKAPKGFHAVVFALVVLTVILNSRRQNFLPGSYLYDKILHHFPGTTEFLRMLQAPILFIIFVVHISEATWFDRSRLVKHNIPRLSRLWWTWIISNLVEGVGSFQRFDRLVARKQEEKDQARH